jgi:hypothetical protein
VAGRDITEGDGNVWALAPDGLPIARGTADIGIVSTDSIWQNTNISYDFAIGGMPFISAVTDNNEYIRETAPFRKDQFDNGQEPGEQSLTGWWLRSQMSFHGGAGINFYDPLTNDESGHYRFNDSKGVNVWTKGEVTMLKDCAVGHITTGAIRSNKRPFQSLRSIEWTTSGTTFAGGLLWDEYDVDKIKVDDPSNPVHFIDYNAGTDAPVFAICDDGTYAYWITNTATKKTVYKKPLNGSAADNSDRVTMFDEVGLVTNATMEYVKDRIVMCADNKVYEFATSATLMPTVIYPHPTTTHVYSSITASGPAIYIAGYNGIQSTIQKFTLSTAGAMPALTSAITAAELPVGEIVHKIYYYLGYIIIGTDKGIRVGLVSDQDGSITYGPLIVETSQPCYDFAARDHYVWCATGVAGEPGVIRIDLSNELETLRFAYANDLYVPGVTGFKTTACAFADSTNRLMFATANNGATDGNIYVESLNTLCQDGYLTTGNIRFGTLEPKNFKRLVGRGDFSKGMLTLSSVDNSVTPAVEYDHITYDSVVGSIEVATSQPSRAAEYLAYKFVFRRDVTDTSTGPLFKGYQAKATIATPRQRLIQFPVYCYDVETDRNGVQVGYEDRAQERLLQLESVEDPGDIILWQDLNTRELRQVQIEKIRFTKATPPSGRFSGSGGIIEIVVRTV